MTFNGSESDNKLEINKSLLSESKSSHTETPNNANKNVAMYSDITYKGTQNIPIIGTGEEKV